MGTRNYFVGSIENSPNLRENVFPQYYDIVDTAMLKLAMEFEEADREV